MNFTELIKAKHHKRILLNDTTAHGVVHNTLVGAEKICRGMAKMAPVLVVRNTLVSMFRRMPLTASFKENIFQQPGGRNKGPGKLRT